MKHEINLNRSTCSHKQMMKHLRYWLTTPCHVARIVRKGLRKMNKAAHLNIVTRALWSVLRLHIGSSRKVKYTTGSSVRKDGGELLSIPLDHVGKFKANRMTQVRRLPTHTVATIESIHLELVEWNVSKKDQSR